MFGRSSSTDSPMELQCCHIAYSNNYAAVQCIYSKKTIMCTHTQTDRQTDRDTEPTMHRSQQGHTRSTLRTSINILLLTFQPFGRTLGFLHRAFHPSHAESHTSPPAKHRHLSTNMYQIKSFYFQLMRIQKDNICLGLISRLLQSHPTHNKT